jgi:hypothetical protein
MKQSEQINELAAALAKAQSVMPKAKMSGINSRFADKATGKTGAYATLDDIRDAVKETLTANGISYTQHPYSINGEVGVETMLIHSSGQWMRSRFGVPSSKHDPQAYGSLLTYVRKFALAAAAGVSTQEDTDADEVSHESPSPTISAEQVGKIQNLLAAKSIDEKRILKWKNIKNLTELRVTDYDTACEIIANLQ